MMNIGQLTGPIVDGSLLLEVSGCKTPFILMEGIQIIMAFTALPFLTENDSETEQLNSAHNLKHLNSERYADIRLFVILE
jgi:hypothetical protein